MAKTPMALVVILGLSFILSLMFTVFYIAPLIEAVINSDTVESTLIIRTLTSVSSTMIFGWALGMLDKLTDEATDLRLKIYQLESEKKPSNESSVNISLPELPEY